MLSRLHLIPERNGQTDDRFAMSISRVSMLTRDKNLSPIDSYEHSSCVRHKDFHFTCYMLLHYLVKVENLH